MLEIGYLRLNRDIPADLKICRTARNCALAGRVAFAQYWSIFGSGVINLTDRGRSHLHLRRVRTDPHPAGRRLSDDCLEMGLTWRRDYVTSGDAERGNTFQVYFALRNLGFRESALQPAADTRSTMLAAGPLSYR